MVKFANEATAADIALWRRQCGLPVGPAMPARSPIPRRGRMNKTEAAYAQHLELLVRAKQIRSWAFEPIRLRLAKGAWYTPDFLVVRLDRSMELHEVKGFMREAAHLRLKVAAQEHPEFLFVVVKRGSQGHPWSMRAVTGLEHPR